MAWLTPVIDRTGSSGETFEISDFNRMSANAVYIEDYLALWLTYYGICIPADVNPNPPTLQSYTDQTIADMPKPSIINKIENNVELIKINLGVPLGWQLSVLDWEAGDRFLFSDANRIESNLTLLKASAEALKDRLTRIYTELLYCGTFNCGQGNLML